MVLHTSPSSWTSAATKRNCNGRFFVLWLLCTIDQQPWPWPFNIWVLECVGAKAYCRGCHRHLVKVVSLIGMSLLLLLCYNCHIIFLLLLIFTNNNSCHSFCYDTIFSTGTIIILMPPSQHYNTTEFTYSHPPLIQHQHFSHAPTFTCTDIVWYDASTINLAQRSSRNISLHNVPSTQSFHTSSHHLLIHMYYPERIVVPSRIHNMPSNTSLSLLL